MPEPKKIASNDPAAEKLYKLRELFPGCVTERRGAKGESELCVDFDLLRQELSGSILEENEERYAFTWPGKRAAIALSQAPAAGVLLPDKEESVNFDSTENLYLEGDNLEVLKLLRKNYAGRVKCIYIDPPYNTGNDFFVYDDDFSMTNKQFAQANLAETEDKDAVQHFAGSEGRFHTGWLNMMLARLRVARELLAENGVLVISISDAEFHNLKMLCDEIFGAENYCGNILWNSTKSVTNTALLSVSHTYNLVYFRSMRYFMEHRSEFRLPDDGTGFSNPDHDPRGPWKADPFQVGGWRPNQQYEITNPKTGVVYKPNPGCSWKNDFHKFQELLADHRIVFGKTGKSGPKRKRFLQEAQERGKVSTSWWDDVETTKTGTQLLKKLFDGVTVFDNAKPVGFLKKILQLASSRDGIVLDFFSGSASTAHAVMELNAEDGGTRKFIMVQRPEKINEKSLARAAGYQKITEIGKERIRRAGKLILQTHPQAAGKLDVGFRVYKLKHESA